MDNITIIFLGVVQGLTEFLPISSSGHLVLFQDLFGLKGPQLIFDIFLHMGTLLAVCIFLRSDLMGIIRDTWRFSVEIFEGRERLTSINRRPNVMMALWVITATIPTALMGLLFRSPLEALFGNVHRVGLMMICTGFILSVTIFISATYSGRRDVGLLTSLAVGIAQGLAIIPGISRSGTTIVCGMACGMEREVSARFSFLLSIPAIIGAMLLQLNFEDLRGSDIFPLLLGLVTSAISGFFALKILMGVVRRGRLFCFAPYCWLLGLLIIIFRYGL
jgi:undecaprenyl-diphosphatase